MRSLLLLLIFFGTFNIGYSTTVPPPSVKYRIINNTIDSLYKLIQIQSNDMDFEIYDTFAVESNFSSYELRLYNFERSKVKKYQKLIVFIGDTVYETESFDVPTYWIAYNLTINSDSVSLDRTYYYKIRKTLSDILLILPLIFIIKFVIFLLISHGYMRKIYREFTIINLLFPLLFYLSISIISLGEIAFLLILVVILGVFGGEILLYNRRLGTKNDKSILISTVVGNAISLVFGGILTLILINFIGVLFNAA